MNDNDVVTDTTKIDLKNLTSISRNDSKDEGGIRHWYGSNFYCWGNQSVRDKAKEIDQVRYVYYVNKINVE
jgi:hypothetical protein